MDYKSALLYSKLNKFKRLVHETEQFIKDSLQQVKNPYVACSFGKDSIVMLHLILEYKPDIKVIWITFPETKYLNNYYEVSEKWKEIFKINLEEIFIDIPADVNFNDKEAFPKHPYDSYFVGITSEESVKRRITLKTKGKFYKKNDGMIRIAPLANWQINDIAAYILSNKLPFLESYKNEGFESRTVTGFTEDLYAFRLNQLNELKHRNIISYNQLITEYPGLKNYV